MTVKAGFKKEDLYECNLLFYANIFVVMGINNDYYFFDSAIIRQFEYYTDDKILLFWLFIIFPQIYFSQVF